MNKRRAYERIFGLGETVRRSLLHKHEKHQGDCCLEYRCKSCRQWRPFTNGGADPSDPRDTDCDACWNARQWAA